MKRREFILALGGAAAASSNLLPLTARAQQGGRKRKIAVIMSTANGDAEGKARLDAFLHSLQELGWTQGGNIEIADYWIAGDAERIRAAASEIALIKPDVILSSTTPVVAALRSQSQVSPIVFVLVSDPVGSGFVESLARPGGNITGFINIESSIGGKWLELLKEIVPKIKHAGLLFNPDTAPYVEYYLAPIKVAAASLGIEALAVPVRSLSEIEPALLKLTGDAAGGVVVMPDAFTGANRRQIISQAERHKVPAMYPYRYMAQEGGLISYGIDTNDLYRRAALYVDRLLKGAKPAELPVQQPTKFELAINVKTAKTLGLTVPPILLASADEVIE
ncbi:MAG TPA: ABC transporter substrate-binding protein [Pseudolabrys sp.]|nr:ABC transporter substrate-binding protein [Pseudolabrys sp.]